MQQTSHQFSARASRALLDAKLQRALARMPEKFVDKRAAAFRDLGTWEALRDQGAAIRQHALDHLAEYLETFERAAQAAGAVVHWAADAGAARRIIRDIARRHGVQRAVKSKSMVSEECALNEALEADGIEVVETDLGEYILQLAREPPSHIVAPVIHKNKEEVSALFAQHHRKPPLTGIAELCREAREVLRPKFLTADMGITGANFLVAETGSAVIVTNEGNGRLSSTLPRVQVTLTGIEKLVPTLEDLAVLLRLLTRSATGQPITNYVSLMTGPRRAGDGDGPEHYHIVLLDNGRGALLRGEFEPMLRCIRCAACMNHCPVYQSIGGHAYGWVYPGPMGSVLTPLYTSLAGAGDLPNASTFCGACADVCPVKIPLPGLLRQLRERQVAQGLRPGFERLALRGWAWLAQRPALYRRLSALAAWWLSVPALRVLGARLPIARRWARHRALPRTQGRSFMQQYRQAPP